MRKVLEEIVFGETGGLGFGRECRSSTRGQREPLDFSSIFLLTAMFVNSSMLALRELYRSTFLSRAFADTSSITLKHAAVIFGEGVKQVWLGFGRCWV